MSEKFDIIVVGAGMVGVSTALWAQKAGFTVAICDANSPGSGCSFGPACVIADYACLPVNNPSLIRNIPYLLFSKESPLSMNASYALRNPKWLASFLLNCRQSNVNAITRDLAWLLARAGDGLDPLIALADADDLVLQNGVYYVWSSEKGYKADREGLKMRAKYGVAFETIDGAEFSRREPRVKALFHRAAHFYNARHVLDTEELIGRMSAVFVQNGGTIIAKNVDTVNGNIAPIKATLADGINLLADHIIICAGAYSKLIGGVDLRKIPLGTERGYHVTYKNEADRLTCPVGWAEAGFYVTPMKRGLRFAGTVEIAALEAPMNQKRIAYIHQKAQALFGDLNGESETWLGRRPTLPDARPVLGSVKESPNIWHNFGHQHLGITLGGISGKLITQSIETGDRSALAPFLPNRF